MTKEESAKRFCKFELCTHRNGEGMCCLYNQENCIFHKLEKENERLKGDLELWESGGCRATNLFKCGVVKELKEQIEKMKRHCNCKHRDSEGYCEVKRTYLIDLSYDGCDKKGVGKLRRYRKMNDLKGIIEDVEKSSLVSDKVIKKVIEILGQENWNYINDEESDICTTAGELIITLKGIPDLETENAELKELLNCNNCSELSEEECEVCAEYSHFKCKRKDLLTKAKDHIKQNKE